MINYTERLDKALREAARAHEKQKHHRKGTDIPYIIHPVAVMLTASNVTDEEDILIACLLHDVLEDVDESIYSESDMQKDFGDRVVLIVKDVTKKSDIKDWRQRSEAYLHHLKHQASDEAIIVSASDKIHNLTSIVIDYNKDGDKLWERFNTKSAKDQLWWYSSILEVLKKRQAPKMLIQTYSQKLRDLKAIT